MVKVVWAALTIIFVVSRIAGWITWSWWLVLAPLWGPVLGIMVLYLIVLAGVGVEQLVMKRRIRKLR